MLIEKVISGGQTGVDRAALDVAIELGIPHGGWCPAGRRAEDGEIPQRYRLTETDSPNYIVRTEQNVIDSDGTLVLFRDQPTGGTGYTVRMIQRHQRPYYLVDLNQRLIARDEIIEDILSWIGEHGVRVLNVAGPRQSTDPAFVPLARDFLEALFRRCGIQAESQADETKH